METLAERIAGGELDDLAEQLPEDLHPALERGKASTGGKAQKMSLDEFIERIARPRGNLLRTGPRTRARGALCTA
jgi:uncharacterized protein (DUF2267 family)